VSDWLENLTDEQIRNMWRRATNKRKFLQFVTNTIYKEFLGLDTLLHTPQS
jgi:hypothetical protein